MANISQIKIINGTTYSIVDSGAARAEDLGGLSFALDNLDELQITGNNATITAATDTTLASIATAIGELADLWEEAATATGE